MTNEPDSRPSRDPGPEELGPDEMVFTDCSLPPLATALPPGRNGQYATVRIGEVVENEVPVWVDLDVMREIQEHARSNQDVELGGVLLGGQYRDEQGQPFVLITDSLRARHYEATKGSFKFTHDTWQQITRERETRPAELAMVGWYHTHPGWGVFLSGLDLFICDHFFNKLLDVALVVDPCRHDTGLFQWTSRDDERIARASGYYLFASRFRQEELTSLARELEGHPMPDPARSGLPPITVQMPAHPTANPLFLGIVLGWMAFQSVAVLWWMWTSRTARESSSGGLAAAEMTGIPPTAKGAANDPASENRVTEVNAKLAVLEELLRHQGGTPDGVLTTLAARTAEVDELRGSLRGQQSLNRELDATITRLKQEATDARQRLASEEAVVIQLRGQVAERDAELSEARDEAASLRSLSRTAQGEKPAFWRTWVRDLPSLGWGLALGSLLVGGGWVADRRRRCRPEREEDRVQSG